MTLNYKSYGEGDPVIILHGFLGMLDNWHSFARMLAEEGFEVFTIDLRNHGKSPHSDVFSYDIMASDVIAWMDAMGIESSVMIGHSMGGKAVMRIAFDHPERVERAVLVDIAPRPYMPGHQAILNALVSVDPATAESRTDIEEQLMYRLNNLPVVRFLMKNLARNGSEGYTWKMNLPVLVENYFEIVKGIESDDPFEGPALFVRGANSDYVLDDDILDIQELFPQARLVTVPGAGHWVHADNPDYLLDKVVDFCRD